MRIKIAADYEHECLRTIKLRARYRSIQWEIIVLFSVATALVIMWTFIVP